ncbi:hypothetical protein F2P81_003408 [Scophthalmus maximus]|uniref:Uncharacterized protein n=1 Tax=Scophthalmus maximus TaxID=52904 RepID=A0A6A4TKU7_SCOMX|nr:hypothetical protein F2P81_003408 [Scophthalmus maximus]
MWRRRGGGALRPDSNASWSLRVVSLLLFLPAAADSPLLVAGESLQALRGPVRGSGPPTHRGSGHHPAAADTTTTPDSSGRRRRHLDAEIREDPDHGARSVPGALPASPPPPPTQISRRSVADHRGRYAVQRKLLQSHSSSATRRFESTKEQFPQTHASRSTWSYFRLVAVSGVDQTGLRRPVSHVGPDQYQFTLKRPDRFSVPLRRVCEKLQEQRGGGRRDEAQERGLLSGEEMEGVPSSTAGSWRFQLPTQEVSARRERETVLRECEGKLNDVIVRGSKLTRTGFLIEAWLRP